MLAVLRRPQYGYAIKQQIALDSVMRVHPTTGTLYPALRRLTKQGWLEETEPAGYYRLSSLGEQMLRFETDRLTETVRRAETRFTARKYGLNERHLLGDEAA